MFNHSLGFFVSRCSAPSAVLLIAVDLANQNRVAADNLNILPANAYALPFAAYTPISGTSENNQGNHPPAAGIHLNVAHKTQPAAVGFVNNLLAPKLCYTAIHFTPPNSSSTYHMPKKQKTDRTKTKLFVTVCAVVQVSER